MPWNWNVHGEKVGRPAEAAEKATWQDYDAEYLKTMLRGRGRYAQKTRYDATDLGDAEKQVYLQEVTKGYEREAEACLKQEFKQWLQGTHEENYKAKANELDSYYNNERGDFDGGPKRRGVHGEVFDLPDNVNGHTGWQATRWGTKPLTHLEGVRDFLRDDLAENDAAERDMNLLAHYGPQNLDEAWIYFKHWVKRRPVSTRCNPRELRPVDSDNPRMIGTGPSNWQARTPDEVEEYGSLPVELYERSPDPRSPLSNDIVNMRTPNYVPEYESEFWKDGELQAKIENMRPTNVPDYAPKFWKDGELQAKIENMRTPNYVPVSNQKEPWTVGPSYLKF